MIIANYSSVADTLYYSNPCYVESLVHGEFHNHLKNMFRPQIINYVDMMETSVGQSIDRGDEMSLVSKIVAAKQNIVIAEIRLMCIVIFKLV